MFKPTGARYINGVQWRGAFLQVCLACALAASWCLFISAGGSYLCLQRELIFYFALFCVCACGLHVLVAGSLRHVSWLVGLTASVLLLISAKCGVPLYRRAVVGYLTPHTERCRSWVFEQIVTKRNILGVEEKRIRRDELPAWLRKVVGGDFTRAYILSDELERTVVFGEWIMQFRADGSTNIVVHNPLRVTISFL